MAKSAIGSRAKAQRVLQTVAVDGSDPSGEREAFRTAPTVNDLLDRYIFPTVPRRLQTNEPHDLHIRLEDEVG